jgi:L-aminopeptidase/D-esterase-like protein
MKNSLTDIAGIKVGHFADEKGKTGCTVLLFSQPAKGAADIRGSATGTRELDVLNPLHLVPGINALLLTGGSAFGLDAAGGVQQYLEERDIGFSTQAAKVPIVPAAVIYDLAVGSARKRPDKQMGYNACKSASSAKVEEGLVGAAKGARVGKILGYDYCMKGGIGSTSLRLKNGVIIGSLAVANPFGDVIDYKTNKIIAGARHPQDSSRFLSTEKYMLENPQWNVSPYENTTLGVVATDAELSRVECLKVAQMAQNGIGRVIRPAHTRYDGDIIFAFSLGHKTADINLIGSIGAELIAEAIIRGVKKGNEG